jgi:hypothetical protein
MRNTNVYRRIENGHKEGEADIQMDKHIFEKLTNVILKNREKK